MLKIIHNMLKSLTVMHKLKEEKKIKPMTIGIIVVAIIALAFFGGYISLDTRVGPAYVGRIQATFLQLARVDGTAYEVASTQLRVIHGDMDYNNKVGTVSSGVVTGTMTEEDHGIWYLCIDYGTNNTCWIDTAETLKDPFVTRVFGADGDRDGIDEDYVELNFASLPPIAAGEDKQSREVTIIYCPARRASITFTSLTNASSVGTAAYSYYTATGYMGGFTEGDLAKLAMIELVFSDDGNTTYPDKQYQYFKLTHLTLGPYTFTKTHFGDYDLANTRYQYSIGDLNNHLGGKPYYYAKNAGDLWSPYELKAYCNFPAVNKTLYCHMKFYFYQPSGVLTSAFERLVTFSSW